MIFSILRNSTQINSEFEAVRSSAKGSKQGSGRSPAAQYVSITIWMSARVKRSSGQAFINVERESQKGILVGKSASMINAPIRLRG